MANRERAAAALAACAGDGLGLIAHLLAEVERLTHGAKGEDMDTVWTGEEQQALAEFLAKMAPQGADDYLALNMVVLERLTRLDADGGRDSMVRVLALLSAVQLLANKICRVLEECEIPVPHRRSEIQPLTDAVTAELRRRAAPLDAWEH